MKKITVLSAALAASALLLAGCGQQGGGESTAPTSPTSESTSTPVTPVVTSVAVTPKSSTLGIGETLKLNAVVSASGGAATTVTWTSSNEAVATVSSSGVVTAKAVGSAVITATSTFDGTKSDTASVTVVDKGFAPEYYDDGYTFTKDWSVAEAAIKKFIGEGEYSLLKPSDLTNGMYFKEYAADPVEQSSAYLDLVVDGTQSESYYLAGLTKGMFGYYTMPYAWLGIDMTYFNLIDESKTYLSFIVDGIDEETFEPCAPTSISFYHIEDLYYTSPATPNTSWQEDEMAKFEQFGYVLPFVSLGSEYQVDYDEDYGTLEVYDFNVDWTLLDNYGAKLEAAGFTYDEENMYYTKPVDELGLEEYVVYFEFGDYGNDINLYKQNRVLSEWPSAAVHSFVSEKLSSKFEFPEVLATSDKAEYTMAITEEEGEFFAGIEVYSMTYVEFEELQAKFIAEGYSVEYTEQSNVEYGRIDVQKGYIQASLYYLNDQDSETGEYSDLSGTVHIEISDSGKYEDPGIYIDPSFLKLSLGKTLTLEPIIYDLGDTSLDDVVYEVRSGAECVEVSATGVVTAVAEGVAVIRASVVYNEETYFTEVAITVVNEVTDKINLALTGVPVGTAYTDWTGKKSESDAVYGGQCAGQYGSIQIRSKNANSGIVSTTSGGTLVSVTLTFNENQTNSNPVNIYASNTAFVSPSELFKMTPVGTITPAAGESVTYTFEASYAYIGIASSSGAQYIDEISVVWAA